MIELDAEPSLEIISEVETIPATIVAPEKMSKVQKALDSLLKQGAQLGPPSDALLELFVQYGITLVYSRNLEDVRALLFKFRRCAGNSAVHRH